MPFGAVHESAYGPTDGSRQRSKRSAMGDKPDGCGRGPNRRFLTRSGPLAACRSAIICEHHQAHSATLKLSRCGGHMERFHHTFSALQAVAARGITQFS